MEITKESIIQDFRNLGVQKGDCIFVTANLLKTGYVNRTKSRTMVDWQEIFEQVIGNEGTMIVASYTKAFFRLKKNKDIVFNRFSHSTSGALSNLLVKNPEMFRSSHPTNSCVGFGKYAREILIEHTENSLSYSLLGDIIKKNGKFVHIGTIDEENAPQGFHYAQEILGITKFNPYSYLLQSYFEKNGETYLFTRKDVGGCSKGAKNFYGELMANNAIVFGNIGKTLSAIMPSKESFEIIRNIYKDNKAIARCNNQECIECYGNPRYNGINVIYFYIKLLITNIKSWVIKLKK